MNRIASSAHNPGDFLVLIAIIIIVLIIRAITRAIPESGSTPYEDTSEYEEYSRNYNPYQ
jgi:hypothetical protein